MRISVVLCSLTLAIAFWLAHVLGMIGYRKAVAAEVTAGPPPLESFHKSLEERAREMDKREETLAARERKIVDKEALMKEQLERSQKLIDELRAKVKALEPEATKPMEALKTIYEKMEAKRAAKIFNELDLDLSVRLLSAMNRNKSADILAKMSPARARQVTELLNKRAPASTPISGQ